MWKWSRRHVFSTKRIFFTRLGENLKRWLNLIGKCELVDSAARLNVRMLSGLKRTSLLRHWLTKPEVEAKRLSENEKRAITIESISGYSTGRDAFDLMAIETDLTMMMEGIEDKKPWIEGLTHLRNKMEEVASANGFRRNFRPRSPTSRRSQSPRTDDSLLPEFLQVNVPTRNRRVYP